MSVSTGAGFLVPLIFGTGTVNFSLLKIGANFTLMLENLFSLPFTKNYHTDTHSNFHK